MAGMAEIIYGYLVSLLFFIFFNAEDALGKMARGTGIKVRVATFLVCAGSLSLGSYLLFSGSARYIAALFEFADISDGVFFGVGVVALVGGVALLLSEKVVTCKN